MTTTTVNNGTTTKQIDTTGMKITKYDVELEYQANNTYNHANNKATLNITNYIYTDPCTTINNWNTTNNSYPPVQTTLNNYPCVKATTNSYNVQYSTYPIPLAEHHIVEFDYFVSLNSFASLFGLITFDQNSIQQCFSPTFTVTNTGNSMMIQVGVNGEGGPRSNVSRTKINNWGHASIEVNNYVATFTYETTNNTTYTYTADLSEHGTQAEYGYLGIQSIMNNITVACKDIKITQY